MIEYILQLAYPLYTLLRALWETHKIEYSNYYIDLVE